MDKEKILYLECYSGISGDMTVGALLDLGASRSALERALKSLGVGGYHLHFGRKKKCGIDAYDFDVHLEEGHEEGCGHSHPCEAGDGGKAHSHSHGEPGHDHSHPCGAGDGSLHIHGGEEHPHSHGGGESGHSHSHGHFHRNLPDIFAIIGRLDAADGVKELAMRIFTIVAEAESKAHGIPVDEVHFHEVGAIDSIVDIVSTAVCLDDLGIRKVIVSPLSEGRGYVRCQHGVMPVPVPATANIVSASGLELRITDNDGEMVTPTGAAIAAALHCGEGLPEKYRIAKIGIGAGNKDFKNANILRAMVIEPEEDGEGLTGDRILKLETNLDDCTGEALGFAMEALMGAGAADVWYTPVFMKKNRPGYLLSVLCRPELEREMESLIFRHTTTIGIRKTLMERTVLRRRVETVETGLGQARVKVCEREGERSAYPEYESVRELCLEHDTFFPETYHMVKEAAGRGGKEERCGGKN